MHGGAMGALAHMGTGNELAFGSGRACIVPGRACIVPGRACTVPGLQAHGRLGSEACGIDHAPLDEQWQVAARGSREVTKRGPRADIKLGTRAVRWGLGRSPPEGLGR